MASRAITIASATPSSRVQRSPKSRFLIRARPFLLTPFLIHPVLPGETLKTTMFQSNTLSDPLVSQLLGWKIEQHFFYVKIRDIINHWGYTSDEQSPDFATNLEKIFIDPIGAEPMSTAGDDEAPSVPDMYAGTDEGGGFNFLKFAMRVIVEKHFRSPGEFAGGSTTGPGAQIGGFWPAQVRERGWMDSLVDSQEVDDGSASIGDPSDATTYEELQEKLDQFKLLQAMNWSEGTFEDYLRREGVRMPEAELHIPERLFSLYKWVEPARIANIASGEPAAQVVTQFKDMKRDKKQFKEPGFIVGIQCIRPKVYFKQGTYVAAYMDRGLMWMPSILRDEHDTSLRQFEVTGDPDVLGPLGAITSGAYTMDMRDLLIHGDQFINYDAGAAGPVVDLPKAYDTNKLNSRYLSSADIDSYFVSDTDVYFYTDGVVDMTIEGWQRDYTIGAVGA